MTNPARNLIFCFDGTRNHPRDAEEQRTLFGLGEPEDIGITNVLKLHIFLGGGLSDNDEPFSRDPRQHSCYYSGVGTHGDDTFTRAFNVIFAPVSLDVRLILNRAGNDLRRSYRPGDRVFLFGFSRGAAIARRFASVLPHYLPHDTDTRGIVHFLGVFDTVAAMGLDWIGEKPALDVVFEHGNTLSPTVARAVHLIALDEQRRAFAPTLFNQDPRVTEIWFPGAHADVGGGFKNDGLSDIALAHMLSCLTGLRTGVNVLPLDAIDYSRLSDPAGEWRIERDDLEIDADPFADIHYADGWLPSDRLLTPRKVHVLREGRPAYGPDTGANIDRSVFLRRERWRDYAHDALFPDDPPLNGSASRG
uniref:Uncharacterized alpha/beta hydrolase domain (DUF2235) n=1 Tax=Candidatus Kentrum sp. FM TaxID=2126340 RepID=A0A450RUY1_9GAMM|nr:MAG: Uncharacterized alpha/beta hydrolase domain (DUF2235) [Candidatus Kentron sp. FM]VFJ43612.1 MAG: Uncharacterized alpha/beta hydrolase domain (DUF2235) [Candidatus Kentron sp. FM]VFK05635.1 MAG: Uncharacterized alpha/beta hydrolase domain (DUF2235) [Candidatus Kentron sp. FM]